MVASVSLPALGTTAGLFLTNEQRLGLGREILEEELAAIDQACSRFRSDSELSQVNAAGGRTVRVSELFIEAVEVAVRAARLTDGDVDPTVGRALRALGYDRDFASITESPWRSMSLEAVPGWHTVRIDRALRTVGVASGVELDLGATAKALAADRAAQRIADAVDAGVLVNLGGDLSIAGLAPAEGWRVRVTDDHDADADACGQTVSLASGGLATSSTTVRRWIGAGGPRHHIVDPRSGESATVVWRTVSVTAASCVDANIASTAAIIRGARAPAWLDGLGLPARLVSDEGQIVRVAGWPQEAMD